MSVAVELRAGSGVASRPGEPGARLNRVWDC